MLNSKKFHIAYLEKQYFEFGEGMLNSKKFYLAYLRKQYFEFGEGKFNSKKFHLAHLGKQYLEFGQGKYLKLEEILFSILGEAIFLVWGKGVSQNQRSSI